MTTPELRNRLVKCSPFLLKTNIENELNFSFNNGIFSFNGKEIGAYEITEHAERFLISISGCADNRHQFEIQLDYNDKPVILFLDNLIQTFIEDLRDQDIISLMPKKQVVDDEKTEL